MCVSVSTGNMRIANNAIGQKIIKQNQKCLSICVQEIRKKKSYEDGQSNHEEINPPLAICQLSRYHLLFFFDLRHKSVDVTICVYIFPFLSLIFPTDLSLLTTPT